MYEPLFCVLLFNLCWYVVPAFGVMGGHGQGLCVGQAQHCLLPSPVAVECLPDKLGQDWNRTIADSISKHDSCPLA